MIKEFVLLYLALVSSTYANPIPSLTDALSAPSHNLLQGTSETPRLSTDDKQLKENSLLNSLEMTEEQHIEEDVSDEILLEAETADIGGGGWGHGGYHHGGSWHHGGGHHGGGWSHHGGHGGWYGHGHEHHHG